MIKGISFLRRANAHPKMEHHMPTKNDSATKEKFLAAMRSGGNVTKAVKEAGISRRVVYLWRNTDSEFADAWKDAKSEYIEKLEAEADRRAVEGVTKQIYFDDDGKVIGETRNYSDTLLIFRLKALKPGLYRDPPQGIDPRVFQEFLAQALAIIDDTARQRLLSWVEGKMQLNPFNNNN